MGNVGYFLILNFQFSIKQEFYLLESAYNLFSGAGVQNQPSEVIYAGDFGFHKGIMDTVVVKGVE